MALIRLRNPLAFPGGRPGFNPAHPASQFVAAGSFAPVPDGSYINLIKCAPAIGGGGSVTYGINSAGPYVQFRTAGVGYRTVPTAFPATSAITFAAIVTPVVSYPVGCSILAGATNSTAGLLLISLQVYFREPSSLSHQLGITLKVGVPYFVVVSASNLHAIVFVTNLQTGNIQTSTVVCGSISILAAATWFLGGLAADSQCQSNIHAAMFAYGALTMPQLLQWAADPWSYWYPDAQRSLLLRSLRAPPASVVHPLTLSISTQSYSNAGS